MLVGAVGGCGSSVEDGNNTAGSVGAPVGGMGAGGTGAGGTGAGGMGAGGTGAGGMGAAGTTPTGGMGAGGMGAGGMGAGGMGAAGSAGMMMLPPMATGGPATLPTVTGTCPPMTEGVQQFLGRSVQLWVGPDASSKNGPVLFYWHGTGSSTLEASFGYGMATINDVKAQGGLVASFDASGGSGMSTGNNVWYYEDFDTADEVLACAIESVGIDTTRIHAAGMSAGGLQTTAMLYARSSYLASVVVYSGGIIPFVIRTTLQDPANKVTAMIFHGGPTDMVGLTFQDSSNDLKADLDTKGHFSFICDHGTGHTIPMGAGGYTWQFFQDHPYGVTPEPYAAALPASMPAYCTL